MASKITDNYSLINKKLDPNSPFWLKKYTILLKRTESIEKQNLRLLNRLYHMKSIFKRLSKEKRFLMKRLDQHSDDYKKVKFYRGAALSDFLQESENSNCPPIYKLVRASTTKNISSKAKVKKSSSLSTTSSGAQKSAVPKKPLNAFLWYCQEQRDILLQQFPGINHQELTKTISKNWNTLEEKEKESYYEMFDKDRSRYEEEMKLYKQQHPGHSTTTMTKHKHKKAAKKEVAKEKKKLEEKTSINIEEDVCVETEEICVVKTE